MTRPRRLNLDLPTTEPLAPDEQNEMAEHLAFLRQFKPHLGLSLNATEDLLINGVRPPTDRGICKHLLSKLDRRAVERALGREAIKSSPGLRARLLAGVVRITPDVGNLLAYLEALTVVADKRDAAAAFGATLARIDFGTVSAAQMGAVLDVVDKTFQGHERTQALFGLLDNDSFREALERTIEAVPETLRASFAPLSAAHRAVIRGELPRSDEDRARAEQGVAIWLGAPERVLRSYPIDARERLIGHSLGDVDIAPIARPVRIMADSLLRDEPESVSLSVALFDRLLAARQEDLARGLLNTILQAQPTCKPAKRRQEVLAWPRKGRLALPPDGGGSGRPDRMRRVFALDLPGFAWVRFGTAQEATRLEAEAALQTSLIVPGVAPCLGYATGPDATPYVLVAAAGRPLSNAFVRGLALHESLALAADGIRILNAVALGGVELPDAALWRFFVDRPGAGLRLADLDGARHHPAEICRARVPELATRFCRDVFGGDGRGGLRRDLPKTVSELLARRASPEELARGLALLAARQWDGAPDSAESQSPADPVTAAGAASAAALAALPSGGGSASVPPEGAASAESPSASAPSGGGASSASAPPDARTDDAETAAPAEPAPEAGSSDERGS